jgi:hypothetical protein
MDLIKISNEHSINVEEYSKLRIGDIIKSQSQLRQMICYPTIPKDTANKTAIRELQKAIDLFICYENISGSYKIRITSTEPPQKN